MYKQQAIQLQGQQNERLAQVQAASAEKIKNGEMQAKAFELTNKAKADVIVRHHDSDMNIREMVAQKRIENGETPEQPTAPPAQNPQQPPPQNPVQTP
jgi:hypothetical protein